MRNFLLPLVAADAISQKFASLAMAKSFSKESCQTLGEFYDDAINWFGGNFMAGHMNFFRNLCRSRGAIFYLRNE